MYIADQETLEAFIERAHSSSILAIDTEFLREKTYYAQLCLLQMATDVDSVIIDPFKIDNLNVLQALLQDEHITKLFHAGSQDLEILLRYTGTLAKPVFDTQIAAALLGHTQQIGYAALVQSECDVLLKKIESYTDWSRRPLSESQLEYAADDVLYLPVLYKKMKLKLEQKGRLHWLDDDFERLSDPACYREDPRERFRRLKRVSQLSRKQLAAAQEVTAWREKQAQKRDIPRKWVLTDEQIVEACKREALNLDSLFAVRGIKEKLNTNDARTVVSLIRKGLESPREFWPVLDKRKRNEPNVDVELDLMGALARTRAKEHGIAFQTLAPHDDLVRLARGYTQGVSLLTGWRKKLVGAELLDLLANRISLGCKDGELQVTSTSQINPDSHAS